MALTHETTLTSLPRTLIGTRFPIRKQIVSALSDNLAAGLIALPVLVLAGLALAADPSPAGQSAVVICALLFALLWTRRTSRLTQEYQALKHRQDALIQALDAARLRSDEARQRAEDLNAAKSRFLASVSHELRTPLNAILGFSEIMEAEMLGRHDVRAYHNYARDIHESGRMLLGLIDELLDLSRIEAGRFDLVERDVLLAEIAADCAHLVEIKSRSRDLALILLVDQGLSPLRADPRAIRQMILNLLSNAIKFTPPGGEITLEIGTTRANEQFIRVTDTGPGIPAHEIPVILESFGRGSLAIKSAKEGAGLGLPIIRGLVAMHGGTFTLSGREGDGVSALITFPHARTVDAPSLAVLPDLKAA